ncbi:MAG: hypothetical protein IPN70_01610 [Candidatus Moraniibacteriota bacterium]|nr:MAG: hypothetical protein IPN70_01610 [Candidatus Moranbacteria bacterium]
MNEEKKYIITKMGGIGKGPHILTNAENANETVSLCSCGYTENEEGRCDGTHLKIEKEEEGGCCGGGCCGK